MRSKTKILLTILTFYSFIGLQGQMLKVKNQRRFKYMYSVYLDTIGFVKSKQKKIDIDLRIWHDCYTTGQIKLIRLIQFKNEEWLAHSLDFYCYNESHCDLSTFIIDTLNLSSSWEYTWKNIIEEDLLNLPNQDDVNKKLKTENGKFIVVADGSGYCFEIRAKKAKRRFCYSNADNYYEFYKELGIDSKYYKKALKLIDLIDKEFDWQYKIQPPDE